MEGLLEDAVEVGALVVNASVAGVGALTNASSEEILMANGSAAADLLADSLADQLHDINAIKQARSRV